MLDNILYDLDLDQLEWRRWAIHNICNDNIDKFKQNCKGIVLGDFLDCGNEEWLQEYFKELANRLEIPIVDGSTGFSGGSSVPSPKVLLRVIVPPKEAAMCFTIESPSPVPPVCFERLLSTR